MTIQTKSAIAICSTIGNIEEHEKFKKLSMSKRIETLQKVYDEYGVRSNEFFVQVKPFLMWIIHRNLRGMSADMYLEDLINNAYEELIIAFEGGRTTYYNKEVYKEPKYMNEEYLEKYKNIGNFIIAIVSGSVAKYRSKTFKKQVEREDGSQDISERVNFTDFEQKYDLHYEMEENKNNTCPIFKHFKFNDKMLEHLAFIKATKPKNNVLYNFMLWKERIDG